MNWSVAWRPVQSGRQKVWMVIDREAVFATLDDEHDARALVATLNGADQVFRAERKRLDEEEPF